MLITRLALRNFRQHADTDLQLGPGLIGITGPNGAGKSTLLEAIGFALYGVPATRGNKDTIRRRGAPPRTRTEVELGFSLGARHYRLVRSLTTAELYQDDADAPIADSLAAVTQRVERLLGMNREEFYNTYFTGQKELALMASMGATERGRFLSSVLGYERLKDAQERNRREKRLAEAHLDGLRSGQPDPAALALEQQQADVQRTAAIGTAAIAGTTASAATQALTALTPRITELLRQRAEFARLETERRAAAGELPARQEALARSAAAVQGAEVAAAQLAVLDAELVPLPGLRESAQRMALAAGSAQDRITLAALQAEETARLARIEAEIAACPTPEQVVQLVAHGKALRAELEDVERKAADARRIWTQDAQEAQTKRQALRDQYEELKEQRERLAEAGADGLCPTCSRPLAGHRDEVLQSLAEQLEEVRLNGTWLARRVEQLKDEPADLKDADARRGSLQQERQDALKLHTQQQADLARAGALADERPMVAARLADLEARLAAVPAAYDAAAHARLAADVAQLEEVARRRERTAADATRLDAARRQLAIVQTALQAAEAREAQHAAALVALAFDALQAEGLERQHAEAQRNERAAELALVQAVGAREAAESALARAAVRVAEAEARALQIAGAERDVRLRIELDAAFTDLRTDLNAQLRPELAELASSFLRDLTQGRYHDLELDEQYAATILDDGEPKPVISGGEDDVVNLALRLAISQMIAARAGQPLSLLVLDEIFGSLDESRRAAVLDLLRTLADRFPQVVLITHVEQLRDGVDRILRVEFDAEARTSRVRDEPQVAADVAA
jgi:exonuclease SbcC